MGARAKGEGIGKEGFGRGLGRGRDKKWRKWKQGVTRYCVPRMAMQIARATSSWCDSCNQNAESLRGWAISFMFPGILEEQRCCTLRTRLIQLIFSFGRFRH